MKKIRKWKCATGREKYRVGSNAFLRGQKRLKYRLELKAKVPSTIPESGQPTPHPDLIDEINKPCFDVNDKRAYYREEYLKSDHWKELKVRKLVVNPTCEICNSKKFLDVHHLDYKNLYDVLLTDLQTLCRRHHAEQHGQTI